MLQDENGVEVEEVEEESDEGNMPTQEAVPTPPDSPSPAIHGRFEFDGQIIPDIDIYAIPSYPSMYTNYTTTMKCRLVIC